MCKYRNLCISDSEEIDPVYFEKVNLGERLGTYPGDRTISKQETLVYKCNIKFETRLCLVDDFTLCCERSNHLGTTKNMTH